MMWKEKRNAIHFFCCCCLPVVFKWERNVFCTVVCRLRAMAFAWIDRHTTILCGVLNVKNDEYARNTQLFPTLENLNFASNIFMRQFLGSCSSFSLEYVVRCVERNQVHCIIRFYVKRSQVSEFYVHLIIITGQSNCIYKQWSIKLYFQPDRMRSTYIARFTEY